MKEIFREVHWDVVLLHFGTTNPSFTYTMTGFVNGDTQASATSGTPSLTTSAITSSPVGNYAITATVGTLSAANYTFIFVNGTLEVTVPRNMQFVVQGTFTSTSLASPADSGTFVLTPYTAINGTYQGVFDSSGNPLHSGGTGTGTVNTTTNSDYTVNATATLPAGSLCAAQTSPISLATADPLAQIDGLGAGIPGAANGNYLDLPMGDGQGTVTWMIADSYDGTTDQYLSWPSQLYFSTYTLTGICGGQFAWDKVFTLEHLVSGHPIRPDLIFWRRHRHHHLLPPRWRRAVSSVNEHEESELRQIESIDLVYLPW
jgi:hypothetical protein